MRRDRALRTWLLRCLIVGDVCSLTFSPQSHFYEHPIKKGTGAWGPELDDGSFLLLEIISVNEEYRRQGYGKRLFADLWEQALKAAPDCAYALVWPTHLNDTTIESENFTADAANKV